jgi:glycosyltransferase involved in cell wall biosynthesis
MKVLFLAPHLSTGGMPAFLLKRIEALLGFTDIEVFVIEWKCYSDAYTVQRNQIQNLLGNNFISFFGDIEKQKTIVDFCYQKQIDIVHIEEIPEGFDPFNKFDFEIQKQLYDKKHPWKIVETCHNIYFKPEEEKKIEPNGYAFVTPYHLNNTFKNRKAEKSLIPFPIDPSIQYPGTREEVLNENGWLLKGEFHILNIGLWTPGKNQGYAIELARALYEKYGWTYIFHFLGNQAPNFKDYWEPIMQNLPPNVFVLGEREDTAKYFKMADLMLFTSNFECNPIVLKEAISNNTKIVAYNLDHYGDEYLPFINPLTGNLEVDKLNIINTIHSPIKYKLKDYKDSVKEFALKHKKFYQQLNGK